MGVVKGGEAFCACGCGSMFSSASVYVDPPCYFEGVLACSIWSCGISVDVVVCFGVSSLSEYSVVDRVDGFWCSVVLCFYRLAEICV